MKIMHGQRQIELKDSDPAVAKILALLYEQPSAAKPIETLWHTISGPLRDVLVTLAKGGDLSQEQLEKKLGVSGVGLRGRNAALARVAKRIGADYPIQSSGGRREYRRFSLAPGIAKEVLKLSGNP